MRALLPVLKFLRIINRLKIWELPLLRLMLGAFLLMYQAQLSLTPELFEILPLLPTIQRSRTWVYFKIMGYRIV